MRVQPICANQQLNSFQGMKVRKINIRPRLQNEMTYKQEQERNYLQAIIFGLAFVAASLTKCFIDRVNNKHHQAQNVEIMQNSQNAERQNIFQLK